MKTIKQYLKDNNLSIGTALAFTCNDYYFISENNFEYIIINKDRYNREEKLTLDDILSRINDLYIMCKESGITDINYEKVEFILRTEKLKEICKN